MNNALTRGPYENEKSRLQNHDSRVNADSQAEASQPAPDALNGCCQKLEAQDCCRQHEFKV